MEFGRVYSIVSLMQCIDFVGLFVIECFLVTNNILTNTLCLFVSS